MTLTDTQRRSAWFVLIAAFIGFRLFVPAVLKPVGYIADWNDYYFFEGWASFTDRGLYPYLHFWMEHPPLFPWFVVAAYRLSAAIPAWHDPHLAFSMVFGTMMLPFEIGNLILIGKIARRSGGPDAGLLAAWVWALLFAPVFFWSAGFEGYPLFFLLLGLYLTVRGLEHPDRILRLAIAAGVVVGIGAMVKVIPLLVLPAAAFAVYHVRRSAAPAMVAATLITATAILAPFAIANPVMTRASMTSLLTRPGWETVWALADGYYSGGAVARPETRLDPATASDVDHESRIPTLPLLALAGVAGLVAFARTRRWAEPVTVIAATAFTLAMFLTFSKGYSPQFSVYVLALMLAGLPNGRGVGYAALLSFVDLLEYPVAILLFKNQPEVLFVAVIARTALIALFAIEMLARLGAVGRIRLAPNLLRGVSAAIIIAGLMSTVVATRADAAAKAERDPQRAAVELLRGRSGATVLFSDRGLYDRLRPLLQGAVTSRLVMEKLEPRVAPGSTEIWEAYVDSDEGKRVAPGLTAFLASNAFPVDVQVVSDLRLTRYITGNPPDRPVTGTLASLSLERAGAPSAARPGEAVPIRLVWQAAGPVQTPLATFVHLLDTSGRVVAQSDRPTGPGAQSPSQWTRAQSISDPQGLLLPATLPSGRYRLLTGVYNPIDGRRLSGTAGDSIDLGEIEVR